MIVSESGNEEFWIALREKSQREKLNPNWENAWKTFDLSMGLTIDLVVLHWVNFSVSGKIRRQTKDQGSTIAIENVLKESKAWPDGSKIKKVSSNQMVKSMSSDRSTRWANDQEHVVNTEKTKKVKKGQVGRKVDYYSFLWMNWRHTRANFSVN